MTFIVIWRIKFVKIYQKTSIFQDDLNLQGGIWMIFIKFENCRYHNLLFCDARVKKL